MADILLGGVNVGGVKVARLDDIYMCKAWGP